MPRVVLNNSSKVEVDKQQYAKLLMAIIRMPVEALVEPSLREWAESELLEMVED